MNEQKKSSEWLARVHEVVASKKEGQFLAKDKFGEPVLLKWEVICKQPKRLREKVKSLSEIIVQSYIPMEMQFARQYPESIVSDWFLKELAPFFNQGVDRVDWQLVEKKTEEILRRFITSKDFAKLFAADDIHIVVTAQKQEEGGELLGMIQYRFSQEHAYGEVKVCNYSVLPTAQGQGLGRLLISSIFKLLPDIKKILLQTRISNEKALGVYRALGFAQFLSKHPGRVELEYTTEESDLLQQIAKTSLT